ncbi:hypothetical protein L9F63_022930, partial [Diploptera punctata]
RKLSRNLVAVNEAAILVDISENYVYKEQNMNQAFRWKVREVQKKYFVLVSGYVTHSKLIILEVIKIFSWEQQYHGKEVIDAIGGQVKRLSQNDKEEGKKFLEKQFEYLESNTVSLLFNCVVQICEDLEVSC